jgi:hypothetical protein
MSQAGNIKGPSPSVGFVPSRVSDGGAQTRGAPAGEEGTRVGRSPAEQGKPGAPSPAGGEEKTRVGRPPAAPPPFVQDGLESRGSSRAERPRDGARPTEVFEKPTPRGTGERPRPRADGAGGRSNGSFESRGPDRTRPQTPDRTGTSFETPAAETPSRTETRTDVPDISFEHEQAPTPSHAEGPRDAPATPRETQGQTAPPRTETPSRAEVPADAPATPRETQGQTPPRAEAPADAPAAEPPVETRGDTEPTRAEVPETAGDPRSETPPSRSEPRPASEPQRADQAERPEGPDAPAEAGVEVPEHEAEASSPRDPSPATPRRAGEPPTRGQAPAQPPPSTAPAPNPTPAGKATPGQVAQPPPFVPVPAGETRELEDLLPEFPEAIGQESLAHHFEEELSFLGQDLRPSRMPPQQRALRLWAFFTAYAEANAKDPSGQSAAGRARFEEALAKNGFAALRDANTGKNGLQTALGLLDAGSSEALREQLAQVRIEPGVEPLPSEVFLPVAEEFEAPSEPPVFTKKAASEPAAARKSEPPVDPDETTQPQDAPESQAKAAEPHAKAAATERPPRAAETPQTPEQQQQKQKERGDAQPLAAAALSQGLPNPALVPPRQPVSPRDARQEDLQGPERYGTNKRLGSNMLWNSLHGLRSAPEDSEVLKEKWNQLAFGTIIALVGAALLIAMLASL